jgi:PAS domain S-box-containing protein
MAEDGMVAFAPTGDAGEVAGGAGGDTGALTAVLANPAADRLLGVRPGTPLSAVTGPAGLDWPGAGGEPERETVLTTPAGLTLRLTLRPLGGHVLLTIRDLSAARSAEMRLVDAIGRLNDGFILYDAEDRVVLTNSRFREYYPETAAVLRPGVTFESMVRHAVSVGALVVPDGVTEAEFIDDRIRRHRNPGPAFERVLQSGRIIRVTEYPTAEGGIVSLGVDVTELRVSESRFRDLVQTVPGMVYQWLEGPDGRRGYTYVSPRSLDMYGIPPEELERDWMNLPLHPDDVERWQAEVDAAVREDRDWSFEGRFLFPDGRVRWWRGVARPLRISPSMVLFTGIVIDIDAQKRAEEELRYREAMLRYTAGLAGLGYRVWDPEVGRTVFCSPELTGLFGLPEEAFPGPLGGEAALLSVVHPDDRDYYRLHAVEVARSGRSYVVEYRVLRRDGAARHVREVGGPVPGIDGRLLKYVVAVQDITERKQRELELEEARDRLAVQAAEMTQLARALEGARDAAESASRAKSRFLAVMSHELRTPMTGVIGMIDLLHQTPLSPDQERYLGTLRSSADSLLVVLNDILDFSKIEAGQLTLEDIPLKVPGLMEDAIRLFAPTAAQKGVELRCPPPAFPVPDVTGDPTRLRQVLMNLVGNAVKFTRSGHITLRLTGAETEEKRYLRLRFEVADTGVGIDPALRPILFEAFTQADASTTRKFGGTGLGLAICKRLVGMMGGSIGVESEVGRGSTFWFTVRVALAAPVALPAPAGSGEAAADGAGGNTIRLLLAEDNQVNRLLIVTMLQRMGHSVTAVNNGVEAVAAAAAARYDVILMDMQMPEMDGDTAAAAIRAQDGPCARVPIIALTADVMPEERARRMLSRLFDEYVTKPIDWPRLNGVVTTLAARGRAVPTLP